MQSAHADKTSGLPRSSIPSFRLIQDRLDQVRELIYQQLTAPPKAQAIKELLDYMNSHSGKMIRPGLVLLSAEAVGKITDKHIRIAAIVEMIHNATLLHDDVIDQGQQRRGLATINHLWGNEAAVLLGDFLLSQVFKMCTDLEPEIISIIASTAARTCEGELRQIVERQNWQLSEPDYIEIITEKTAVFLSSCCRLGALLTQASKAQVESLAYFGLYSGIAFQIADDLLDITGDENKTGKTSGRDASRNKLTLAVIHLLRAVGSSEKKTLYDKLNAVGKNKDALTEMLRSHGSLEYAHNRAQEYAAQAIQALADLPESDAKRDLIETARFMANRAA
jgi:octaprenyl-diphosphate synthase